MKKTILVVGTGAIADLLYLPFLASRPQWKQLVRCVDRDAGSLDRAVARHGVAAGGTDYVPLLAEAAVAIVATPPRSHFAIARDCLNAGVHVVMEKPLTNTCAEGQELVRLAKEQGRLLMVNNTRRLFQSYSEIRRILVSGELGELRDIEYAEGGVFAWPTVSGFYFDATEGGRGVISDRGSHVLDLFCWWAGGKLELKECRTDADGGVEGFCDVKLRLPRGEARMRLSWHNKLANRLRVSCERGDIVAGIYDYREVTLVRNGRSERRSFRAEERAFEDYGLTFVRRAVGAAMGCGEPPVSGGDVLGSLALIDECYDRAEPVEFPWLYKYSRRG